MLDTRLLQNAAGPSFRSSCSCFHQVRNAFIRVFSPEERRSCSPKRPETMPGLTKGRSVRPAVRPVEGNSPTIKPYREYVPFDGARCLFSTLLRLQGDHHCACAQKWCHISYFSKSFQTNKFKALRPKMTKIASRGGGRTGRDNRISVTFVPSFRYPIQIR